MRLTLALARIAGRHSSLLDALGERLAACIVRMLASSPRLADRRLALAQLDRIPEWLDLLVTWLDRPDDDDLVLPLLDGDSRLAGPYAQVALGAYLGREVERALWADSPDDALWASSLRVSRWLRKRPSLGRVHLPWLGTRTDLAAVPEALRDLAREVETASHAEAVARVAQEWSDLPGAIATDGGLWPNPHRAWPVSVPAKARARAA